MERLDNTALVSGHTHHGDSRGLVVSIHQGETRETSWPLPHLRLRPPRHAAALSGMRRDAGRDAAEGMIFSHAALALQPRGGGVAGVVRGGGGAVDTHCLA